jgi:phosphoribosylformylglycinamidine synthase subunit PurS
MKRVDVFVTLKNEILDAQGLVIKKATEQMGYKDVSDVRFGKYIQLTIEDEGKEDKALEEEIEYLCDRLLSNPNIEDFRYEVK